MTKKLGRYLPWLTLLVLIGGCVFVIVVWIYPRGMEEGGMPTTNYCLLSGVNGTFSPTTEPTLAAAAKICATQAAQLTAEAAIPDWWPWGH